MKTSPTICLILTLSAVACDKPNDVSTTQTTASKVVAPDNTKVNTRDQAGALTPLDQGNNQADLDTTQAIRKAVMADNTLSSNAKNVKIITGNGTVTLRGPVMSADEKKNVESKAMAAAGSNRVDDQLDIAPTH